MAAKSELGLTIDSAIEKIGFGRFQLGVVAICGVMQATDSMEMILLSFLGRSVQCEWHLSSQSMAWLATCVFVGSMFGGPMVGAVSDRYGRWNGLVLSACFIAYYGAVSAASPNFPWILILRGMVGFAVGGILSLTSTLTGEFLPIKYRSSLLLVMLSFWALGALFEILVAWLSLGANGAYQTDGWRKMMAATSIPLFLIFPFFAWLPKSPRYLLASGRTTEALALLNRVARVNGQPEITEPLIADAESKGARGSLWQLFANRTLTRLTLLMLIIWLCNGFLYYGLILITTELPVLPHRCLQNLSQTNYGSAEISSASCCQALSSSSYVTVTIATLGEFLGYFSNILLIDKIGRRAIMAINNVALCCLMVCLMFCTSQTVLAVILFFCRSCTSAAFSAIYVYTSEAYPTTIRTFGTGVGCAASRIGALLSPFVAQVLLPDYSFFAGLSIYAAVALVCAVAVILLPFDTNGRPLFQTAEETEANVNAGSSSAGTEAGGLRLSGDRKTYSSLGSAKDVTGHGKTDGTLQETGN